MGVHKGQCPRITGRKQCRGTLFPASIMGKKSVGVHSFWPVTIGKRRVQGCTLSCQLISRERRVQGYTRSLSQFGYTILSWVAETKFNEAMIISNL